MKTYRCPNDPPAKEAFSMWLCPLADQKKKHQNDGNIELNISSLEFQSF